MNYYQGSNYYKIMEAVHGQIISTLQQHRKPAVIIMSKNLIEVIISYFEGLELSTAVDDIESGSLLGVNLLTIEQPNYIFII